MKRYSVTFYDFGEILVDADNEKIAGEKAIKRAKQIYISAIHEELEIAVIEEDETKGQVVS